MNNLCGHDNARALFRAELESAGIEITDATEQDECRTGTLGRLSTPWGPAYFMRQWVYISVVLPNGMPWEDAKRINEAEYSGPFCGYSGRAPTLGSVVRPAGYAGGIEITPGKYPLSGDGRLHSWHIDTVEGLRQFVGEVAP